MYMYIYTSLTPLPNDNEIARVCCRRLYKSLWKKWETAHLEQFLLLSQKCLPYRNNVMIFYYSFIVVCNLFEYFRESKIFHLVKSLTLQLHWFKFFFPLHRCLWSDLMMKLIIFHNLKMLSTGASIGTSIKLSLWDWV